eukprot:TRINITY_DN14337_c0_g2_i1.p1 TRINITY_DN14337_c0_g2~~TRINITY_DN14337_c0_g2_i1.p1  ORF type:complete len:186 (-),score=37.21 TRINITY_DN14337_c0_g2_i1:135-692(-)
MVKLTIDSRYFPLLKGFPPAFVKNTFLEFGPISEVELRRCESAPARLQQKAFAFSTQMPASSGRSKKFGGVDDIQNCFARSMQETVDEIQMKQVASQASSSTQLTNNDGHKERLHRLGLCHPCSYFTYKEDGCSKGQDCEFCHICTHEEAKVGRRRIKKKKLREKEQVAPERKSFGRMKYWDRNV